MAALAANSVRQKRKREEQRQEQEKKAVASLLLPGASALLVGAGGANVSNLKIQHPSPTKGGRETSLSDLVIPPELYSDNLTNTSSGTPTRLHIFNEQEKRVRLGPVIEIPADGRNLQGSTSTKIPRGPRLEHAEENHANFRKKNKARLHPQANGIVGDVKEELDPGEGEDGVYRASGSANVVLYVGLGMICIGLVITFVGLGDKGFKTLELKLIGPSLVGCGVFFALLRILFCTLPSCCRSCTKCCTKDKDDKEELMNEHQHSAMTGEHVEKLPRKHLSDLPPINNNNLDRGLNRSRDDMGAGHGDMAKSNLSSNPPLRGRVGPAEEAAPAYSSVVGASTNGTSDNTIKNRTGRKKNNDQFDSENDANGHDSEFASEEDGDFRRKPIRTSKNNSGSQQSSSNGGGGVKKGANKIAKPLSYDNYSTDTSSQFSADIVEVTGSKDGEDHFQNRLATAGGIVAQASSVENTGGFNDNQNGRGEAQARHYPDYSTIPHFPNLQELAASGSDRNGTEEIRLNERNINTIDSGNAVTDEVVLNASRLQVESETA